MRLIEPTAGSIEIAGRDVVAAGRAELRQLRRHEVVTEEGTRWLWLAGRAAGLIWDYESWDALTARQIQLARNVGALATQDLPELRGRANVPMW